MTGRREGVRELGGRSALWLFVARAPMRTDRLVAAEPAPGGLALHFTGMHQPLPSTSPAPTPQGRRCPTAPADLCTVERETLRHLRIFTGRSRGRELGMPEGTYRELENTGARGRLAGSRYSPREGQWLAWEEWAAARFAVTADRLAAAKEHTRAGYQAERERRWQQLREDDPAFEARIEELARLGRPLRDR
ncbi:hypothetical protein ABZ743_31970 [Streptomyces sp. NPDC006662]|uniref:hypothetical protein n=1 Tax=Streptomyces sp. NPDC006662 TaxID=3156902 RepID=UPI0033E83131